MTIITPRQLLHDILKMKMYNGVPEYALKSIEGIRHYMASWLKHTMNITLMGGTNGDNHAGCAAGCNHEGETDRKKKKRRKHRL
jgi:hypothetical protein